MERDVFISIRGIHQLQEGDERDEDIELVSRGRYYRRNGKEYVYYDEQDDTVGGGKRTTIKVDSESVMINNMSSFGGQMRFELGKRSTLIYRTPFGVMEMGITTQILNLDLQEHNWQICIGYTLDIENHYSGEHEVHILVQDSKGEPIIRLIH